MRRTTVAVAVAVLAAGFAVADPPEVLCARVTVVAASPARAGRPGEFSAREVADLEFRVQPDGRLTGEHVLTLRVYTPRGYLFRTIDVPVNADVEPGKGPRGPQARRLPGYPYPVPVVRPVEVASPGGVGTRQEVRVRFPVAGTTIVTSGLYGVWRVEASWDGARTPCTAPVSFRIVP